ncbi:hypothetical protein MSG28_002020 [Choristoneura fumiferana]|uniref:Uncharacterized protein n=1 Tax=Choristoneura fumiferana TaxID=7141 RepID=A0ACC0JTQ4_CHOFU|nr:hypothetical protein MSG28_002020 [Choristoneura fumiferana]
MERIMFSIIYVSLFVSKALAALTADKPYYDLADAENHFAEFVQEYDKKYGSHEEYNKRFEIFKNKLLHINKLNEEHDATFGVNKFSDLTFEEFASSRFSVIPSKDVNATEMITVKKEWVINAPKSLDYRTLNMVTHVKEQGFECTPSDVFAAIGNIEGQYAKKHKKLVTLSEQQIIDCVINSCRSPSVSKLLRSRRVELLQYTCHTSVYFCQVALNRTVEVYGRRQIVPPQRIAQFSSLATEQMPEAAKIFGSSKTLGVQIGVKWGTSC